MYKKMSSRNSDFTSIIKILQSKIPGHMFVIFRLKINLIAVQNISECTIKIKKNCNLNFHQFNCNLSAYEFGWFIINIKDREDNNLSILGIVPKSSLK